jgi:hypothetical protein
MGIRFAFLAFRPNYLQRLFRLRLQENEMALEVPN